MIRVLLLLGMLGMLYNAALSAYGDAAGCFAAD